MRRIEVWQLGWFLVLTMAFVIGLAYFVGGILTGIIILIANGLFDLELNENALFTLVPIAYVVIFGPSMIVEMAFPAMAKLVEDAKARWAKEDGDA